MIVLVRLVKDNFVLQYHKNLQVEYHTLLSMLDLIARPSQNSYEHTLKISKLEKILTRYYLKEKQLITQNMNGKTLKLEWKNSLLRSQADMHALMKKASHIKVFYFGDSERELKKIVTKLKETMVRHNQIVRNILDILSSASN